MDGDELKRRFGRRVQALRDAQGLTQEQLAAAIGRSVDTVGNIERGKNATRIETAYQLAGKLGVPLAELFAVDDKANAANARRQELLDSVNALLDGADEETIAELRVLIEVGLKLARRTG